jgi:membrane protein DedA with SNARE-associated domain
MSSIDTFLVQYGLVAIFLLMFTKSAGVPIPIPADLIILTAAARAAEGKLSLWLAFVIILLAVVAGGFIQYVLARGPGRGVLYRFGRYLGLTPARLDAASLRVKKGGPFGIGLAILVPGVRGAAITACGLADVPVRTFVIGLLSGSIVFLCLHFFLGYLGGTFFSVIGHVLPVPEVITLVVVLFVVAFALWVIAYRRQKAARREIDAASLEVWHEGICPACLALYTLQQLRTPLVDQEQALPTGLR